MILSRFGFIAACLSACVCLGDGGDWLLDPTGYPARVTCGEDRIVMENGLVRREVAVRPGAATTSLRCLATGEEFVRGVSPEARVKFDGRAYCVGGLEGQPILNYLRDEWIGACTPVPGAYVYEGTTVGEIEERFKWKRRPEWLARDVAWPPKGRHVVMRYRPPADAEARDIFGDPNLELDFRSPWGNDWREVLSPKGERTSCRNEGKPGEIMARPGELAYLEHDWPKDAVCVSAGVDAGDGTGLYYATGVQVVLEPQRDEPRELAFVLCPSRRVFFTIVDGAEFQKAEGYNPDLDAELRLGLRNGTWCAWVKQGGKDVACIDLPAKAPAKTLRVGKLRGCSGSGLNRMHVRRIACLKERPAQEERKASADLPRVEVHYEIYDGAPLFSKWVVVSNSTPREIRYDTFSCEELRLAEPGGQRDSEWQTTPFNIHVESNYGYYANWRGEASAAVHFGTDAAYTTQENYCLAGVNTLRCSPDMGPGVQLRPGEANEGFRVWELLFDTTERERRGLELRRMYRIVSPWICENPLMFHKTTSRPEDIRAAIEQCRETGFELIIMSFGSEFDHESRDPAYRNLYKGLADEARRYGLALGGYSLTASRPAGVPEDNVHNPGPDFGCSPCLCSKWGRAYHETLASFMKEAGLGVFENDGPFAGNWCAATNHPFHAGREDSRWRQWRAQSDLYRFCRENGVFVNQPDGYYFEGASKGCGGYRETNCSLPRDRQLVIERQNIYDNSWTRPTTMLWMFVPLSQYQGGGAAATIEPLDEHLDYYSARFANLLGAGSQACWRGPRLYDSPRVRNMVKGWIDFYKRHRRVLDGDMIHLRRADGRDWDGWLMVVPEPGAGERGIASLFNPTPREMTREIVLPLHYAGLSGDAEISVGGEDAYRRVKPDGRGDVRLTVTIPASGWLHVFVRTPQSGKDLTEHGGPLTAAGTEQPLHSPDAWDASPIAWTFDRKAGTVRSTGPGGFAVRDVPNCARVHVSARITPDGANTNEWATLGVALFDDERNFWHAALVQAPSGTEGGQSRYFELAEMRDGAWLAQDADGLEVTRSFCCGAWRPGVPYVLSLDSAPDGICARAVDEKGALLWEQAYAFDRQTAGNVRKAVTVGRAALHATGGFGGRFADLDLSSSEPCPRSVDPSYPPYANDSFVPGVTDRATGFFRVVEREGRWWVIDPLGRGMVLLGIDHVSYYGHYCQRAKRGYYHEFNKTRFPNKADWEADTLGRLKAWGFNALGAGCDPALEHRGLVHTKFLSLGDSLCQCDSSGMDPDLFICPNEHRPGSAFPNVFHPSFPAWADYVAKKKCAPNRDDPWLFGYFIDNELAWWGRGAQDTGLFDAVARLPDGHSARAALRRYLASRGVTGVASAAVKTDFLKLAAERYFDIASAAIRRHDPNHLVLGARFAGLGGAHPVVWETSAKFCDLVTFNCYPWADLDRNVVLTERGGNARRIADAFAETYGRVGRPMLVTEWSFPALDSGLPCTDGAGQRFRTQALRTRATELFARTMLSLPFLVGYDYFMWVDQPPEGISAAFPENSNYGLVSERGVAYPEITSMFARLHGDIGAVQTAGLPPEQAASASAGETASQFLGRAGHSGSATYSRTGESYVVRNAAGIELEGRVGGLRIFDTVKLKGRVLGSYTGMWSDLVNSSQGWHEAGRVVSAEWREMSGRGVLRVTCEARPTETRIIRQAHDVTVFPDRPWFLCDLATLQNAGAESVEVKSFYFREYASFDPDPEPQGEKKTVPDLWEAPARAAWFSPSDGAYFGACTRAPTAARFHYFLMPGVKSQHPDACFAPHAPLVLQPGEAYDPKGTMWIVAVCGLDNGKGWLEATRLID